MKRTNRKGFTTVELVIVIAVIAILAAVLIPTFVSLINKANQSSDIQAARAMDTALQTESAAKAPTELKEVIEILDAAGFNVDSLQPITKDCTFYWSKALNKILLVKDEEGDVLYPNKIDTVPQGLENLMDGKGYIKVDVATKEEAIDALKNGQSITLTGNVVVDEQIVIPADADVTLNLNGYTYTTTKAGERSKYLDVRGTLTIENGTINARGVEVLEGGKLIITKNANVVVNNVDSNGGAAIWVYKGGEVVIDGGTFTAMSGAKNLDSIGYNPGVINNSGKVTINGGTFKSAETVCYVVNNFGEMVINDGTFEGTHGVLANEGTMTVNGGTFTLKAYNDGTFTGHVVYCSNGNVTVNGGTFGGHTSVFCEDGGTITGKR